MLHVNFRIPRIARAYIRILDGIIRFWWLGVIAACMVGVAVAAFGAGTTIPERQASLQGLGYLTAANTWHADRYLRGTLTVAVNDDVGEPGRGGYGNGVHVTAITLRARGKDFAISYQRFPQLGEDWLWALQQPSCLWSDCWSRYLTDPAWYHGPQESDLTDPVVVANKLLWEAADDPVRTGLQLLVGSQGLPVVLSVGHVTINDQTASAFSTVARANIRVGFLLPVVP